MDTCRADLSHLSPKSLNPSPAIPVTAGIPSWLSSKTNTSGDHSPSASSSPHRSKPVLKAGYHIRDGLVWAVLPYDREEGLQVESEDVEY